MRFLHEMAHAALHINPSLSQFYLEALRDVASESSIDLHESFTRKICPCPPPPPLSLSYHHPQNVSLSHRCFFALKSCSQF